MAPPLLLLWRRIFGEPAETADHRHRGVALDSASQASATIFLVLRRMRAPLIILILIFAVTVLGLTLIPGQDADGRPRRMSLFEAFYFMSYTATTIGFGELPFTFTDAQRMWVIAAIYLTVIGWAYAIGSLLSLLQDRAFREAVAMQRFTRKVTRLREPFLLIAGYGTTGELLGRSFDALGRRFVVIDNSDVRIESLDVEPYRADVPGLVADASNPEHLRVAGLGHRYCEGVIALTNDDEVNLAVTMTAALLRPELPVIARTVSPAIEDRMHAFGTPAVVNPFDSFGDHLRLALRAPSSYQLLTWLESGPGTRLPTRSDPPASGRWVVCGFGRFGRELTADLRAEGLEVTVIESHPDAGAGSAPDSSIVVGDASQPDVLARAHVEAAVGFVAGTDNDTTNLSLIAAARRLNAGLYVAARQNRRTNAPLFTAMDLDVTLVQSEVVAHTVYARLSTPLLWRFLQEVPRQSEAWAVDMIKRLTLWCGRELQALWKVRLTQAEAPVLRRWLASDELTLGDLLRDPDDRDRRLQAVPLLLLRSGETLLAPAAGITLAPDDELLFAGTSSARRALQNTMMSQAAIDYVVSGVQLPASWIWRRLATRSVTSQR